MEYSSVEVVEAALSSETVCKNSWLFFTGRANQGCSNPVRCKLNIFIFVGFRMCTVLAGVRSSTDGKFCQKPRGVYSARSSSERRLNRPSARKGSTGWRGFTIWSSGWWRGRKLTRWTVKLIGSFDEFAICYAACWDDWYFVWDTHASKNEDILKWWNLLAIFQFRIWWNSGSISYFSNLPKNSRFLKSRELSLRSFIRGVKYLYVTLSLKCTVQIARDEQLWFAFFSFQNIKRRNFLSHVVAYIFGQVCQKPNQYKTLLWNCCSTQPLHFQFPRAAEMN